MRLASGPGQRPAAGDDPGGDEGLEAEDDEGGIEGAQPERRGQLNVEYNSAYRVLVGDLDLVPFDQPNILWLAFTSPTMRAALPDWDEAVRRMVGQYRAAMADHVAEPAWKCLIKRLQEAAPKFAAMWQRHDIAAPENLTKGFSHPQLGALRFGYTNLWLAQRTASAWSPTPPRMSTPRSPLGRLMTPRRAVSCWATDGSYDLDLHRQHSILSIVSTCRRRGFWYSVSFGSCSPCTAMTCDANY